MADHADFDPGRRARLTAEAMAATGIDEAMIRRLVNRFYARIRDDAMLGPIFTARIADWDRHLTQMVAFWSSVALMTGRYHGQPMRKHLPLPVNARHFDRWLALWEDTARSVCPPAAADHFIERAHRIAASLELGIAGARGQLLAKGARLQPAADPAVEANDAPGFASPPCFLHEIDPVYAGLAPRVDTPAAQTDAAANPQAVDRPAGGSG